MNSSYPFDPSLKHHLLIALGLAIWIFLFLYLTEPLDVNEFGDTEKLIYLPVYGLAGAIVYVLSLVVQVSFWKKKKTWTLLNEIVFLIFFLLLGFLIARGVYNFVVMPGEPNLYTLDYYLTDIFLPAAIIILPIVWAGRWAFGKYATKRKNATKIEVRGQGSFEGLHLFEEDLISIQSSDNYVEVSYLEGDSLKKQLIRTRLSDVEKELPQLERTHRSHLINPMHYKSWQVKNGKHFLVLSRDIEIPISKNFLSHIKTLFSFTTN